MVPKLFVIESFRPNFQGISVKLSNVALNFVFFFLNVLTKISNKENHIFLLKYLILYFDGI